MGIRASESYIHWNYFIALEQDLAQTSRYIEFNENNYGTYSVELAHLLLASASEVDVIAKEICRFLAPAERAENINHYQNIICRKLPEFVEETVLIPRFKIELHPWLNWEQNINPLWWQSYNKVKHQRSDYFHEANLKNVLNAMGGLLIAVFYYYKLKFQSEGLTFQKNNDVTRKLDANPGFIQLRDDYYCWHLLLE
jgi:hypothetical protein